MKLFIMLLLSTTANSITVANEVRILATADSVLKQTDFILEMSRNGTDISTAQAKQQQQQCQQQHQQHGEPDYFHRCENKTLIYRQKISKKGEVLVFDSKDSIQKFTLDSNTSFSGNLYIQCQATLVRYYQEYNYQKFVQPIVDKNRYNVCLENGGNHETCNAVSILYVQQSQPTRQQQQQGLKDNLRFQLVSGDCKIIEIEAQQQIQQPQQSNP